MMASASADGSVMIASYFQGFHRKRAAVSSLVPRDAANEKPLLFHRIYEMDYDSHSKEFRMTDDFLPEVSSSQNAL
jgi:hypothetical protein